MRTTPALVALSLALAAAPALLSAHPGSTPGDRTPPAAERGKDAVGPKGGAGHRGPKDEIRPRGPKGTNHLLHACVTADATAESVELKVLRGNRHMRDVLDGATTFTATLGEKTRVRLVGKARVRTEDGRSHRGPRVGTFDDLDAGDRVVLKFRAPRGGDAEAMPAAKLVVNHGPIVRCEVPPATPPADDGAGGGTDPAL